MPNVLTQQPLPHSDSDDHPLSSDEITTFNCQSDKKISSRYTQLRKQLRSCEHFKENYFVLEVNKPTKSSQDSNTEKRKRKKKQTATTDDHSHPDESLSNDDGSEEMKKKKRKKTPSSAKTTSTQPSTTTIEDKVAIHTSPTNSTNATTISSNNSSTTIQITTSTTCVNNEQQSNETSAPVNQQVSPQLNDNMVLQLMGLLQNNNASNQTCNNQMTLEGLELQIKLLQRLQETINLLKGSSQQTQTLPSQESIPSMSSTNSSMPSIPSSEDIFQQILDYGDCPDNNQSFPVEMTGFASCEDFAELLNGFI